MGGLAFTPTTCLNLWYLRVSRPKIKLMEKFSVQTCKKFGFWLFPVFTNSIFFGLLIHLFACVWLFLQPLNSVANIVGPVFDLGDFSYRKLAQTSLLIGWILHAIFWHLVIIRRHGRRWILVLCVSYCTYVNLLNHFQSKHFLCSGCEHPLLISESMEEYVLVFPNLFQYIFSRSCRHRL